MFATPALKIVRFVSVFLMALAAGVVLIHVLWKPFEAQLSGPT
jgi:hypothetical protein